MTSFAETHSYHVSGTVASSTTNEIVALWRGLEEFNDPIIVRIQNTGAGELTYTIETKIDRGSPFVAEETGTVAAGASGDETFAHVLAEAQVRITSSAGTDYDVSVKGRRI